MRNENGFTLIELLVAIAIIGTLAAIAIPEFAAFRMQSYNARAEADARNAIAAQEAYFIDHEYYGPATYLPLTVSDGVRLVAYCGGSLETCRESFLIMACHERGDTLFMFSNSNGWSKTKHDGDCVPGVFDSPFN